jgi:hypothetical protein
VLYPGGIGSCRQDCVISAAVNRDFGIDDTAYYTFGAGIPGLPNVQTIVRNGSNTIETTCNFLLDCFDDETGSTVPFPISSRDSRAAGAAYHCLKLYSENRKRLVSVQLSTQEHTKQHQMDDSMIFNPEHLALENTLGPNVYQARTLNDFMFSFKGPLWMTQSCNDGSGCPFVQGTVGGASSDQINAQFWAAYGRPGEGQEEFVENMRLGAIAFSNFTGGQRPWRLPNATNIYNVWSKAAAVDFVFIYYSTLICTQIYPSVRYIMTPIPGLHRGFFDRCP